MARLSLPRVAYLDLDGTVTRDGSLFHGENGVTLDAALALARLVDAGVEIVPCSGRTVAQCSEIARLLSARTFIAEMGSAVAYDGGRRVVPTLDAAPDAADLRAEVGESVLEAFPALAWHAPWSDRRQFTLLYRGRADVAKLREWLAARATRVPLTAIDNGQIAEDGTHAYHVLPSGVDKGTAIARDRDERSLPREACVGFGDSEGDLAMAREVGRHYWIGGPPRPSRLPRNVRVTAARFGEGLLEAVADIVGSVERPVAFP